MNNFMSKLAVLLVTAFVLVFAGYQTVRSFSKGYNTETAFQYEVPRFCDTKGLLIRTEEPLTGSPGGAVRYLVGEGRRFRADTPLAKSYATQEEVDLAVSREALEHELEVLRGVQRSAGTAQVMDLQRLNGSLTAAVREYSRQVSLGELENLEESRLKLVEYFSRKQLIGQGESALEESIAQLEAQIGGQDGGTVVRSGQTGYFSRYVDGRERAITPDLLKTLDCQGLRGLLEEEYAYQQEAFGKSVTSHNWYYATNVSLEEAEKFTVGTAVSLTFMGGAGQDVSAVVDRVQREEDGALVILKSDNISADTVSRRVADVKIGFRDYSGLRIPKEALRIVDQKKGVYVRQGSRVVFKEVVIKYTGDDFYLTEVNLNSQTYLNLFEEVFVDGKDLYDGKVLDL